MFGTFPPARVGIPPGPDCSGPHGLLPPLQRETLAFDRPYEAGLAWTFKGDAWKHEMWIDWQRVNTPDHRERFDAGATSELKMSRLVFIPLELHIVHEGGQLYASGPVADSAAFAAGLSVRVGWDPSIARRSKCSASVEVTRRIAAHRRRVAMARPSSAAHQPSEPAGARI